MSVTQGLPSVPPAIDPTFAAPAPSEFGSVLGFMRRNLGLTVAGALAGLAVGTYIVAGTIPKYTATTSLLIDARKLRVAQDAYPFSSDGESADLDLDSQVQLLRSPKVAELAASHIKTLPATPQSSGQTQPKLNVFSSVLESVRTKLAGFTSAGSQSKAEKPLDDESLLDNLSVRRTGKTQVIDISYTSHRPDQAAQLANAFALGYVDSQKLVQQEAAQRAAHWLKESMAELQRLVLDTEQAIQKYKSEHGLLSTEGRPIEDQTLAEANRQMQQARTEAANARVRYAQLQSYLDGKTGDAVALDVVSNPVVSQLRAQLAQLEGQERNLTKQVGPKHDAVKRLRVRQNEFKARLREEIVELAKGMRVQVDMANSVESNLTTDYNRLASANSVYGAAQIELRELERRSQAYKDLYSGVLSKFQSALQQQSFDDRKVRILSSATPPSTPDGPRTARVLALATLLGAAGGSALAFMREFGNNSFRTRRQVRDELGLRAVWAVPRVSKRQLAIARRNQAKIASKAVVSDATRMLDHMPPLLTFTVDAPKSYFSGSLSSIAFELERRVEKSGARSIGVVSCNSGEGATTVAKNLASSLALAGSRTILIDADFETRRLSRSIVPSAKHGIQEAVIGSDGIDNLLWTEPNTGLQVLPAIGGINRQSQPHLLASPSMANLLDSLATSYDAIVVDLPPLSRGIDAVAMASHLDAVVVVVAWGETTRKLVRGMLDEEPIVAEKCLGVVLNRANLKTMRAFGETDVRYRTSG